MEAISRKLFEDFQIVEDYQNDKKNEQWNKISVCGRMEISRRSNSEWMTFVALDACVLVGVVSWVHFEIEKGPWKKNGKKPRTLGGAFTLFLSYVFHLETRKMWKNHVFGKLTNIVSLDWNSRKIVTRTRFGSMALVLAGTGKVCSWFMVAEMDLVESSRTRIRADV